jgi:hypothetical protein
VKLQPVQSAVETLLLPSETFQHEWIYLSIERCHHTLVLNAGAPILTVQAILGHQRIDTTLGYARLYDGTVAADYYRAMAQIERQMALPEDAYAEPPSSGQLLALVDALRNGTLNESQQETVRALRAGLAALAERAAVTVDTDRQIG